MRVRIPGLLAATNSRFSDAPCHVARRDSAGSGGAWDGLAPLGLAAFLYTATPRMIDDERACFVQSGHAV